MLEARHSNDVFVSECKDGPTQTAGARHVRLDAWVMPRSWAHPATTGYEIKTTRADFLRDEKWEKYLSLCHKFYFVAPHGIIDPAELPKEVGLLVCSRNGTKLFQKKRAVARDVTIPEELFRYVLMCRTQVLRPGRWNGSRTEDWRGYLHGRDDRKLLGQAASRKIATIVSDQVTAVAKENHRLKEENEFLAEAKKVLDAMGIYSFSAWRVREAVEERLRRDVSASTSKLYSRAVEGLSGALVRAAEKLDKLQSELDGDITGGADGHST